MKRCHKCGAEWKGATTQPGFKAYCDGCSAYLHCCRNCRFHQPGRPNQCAIPNTETIADRTTANYCEEFAFKSTNDAQTAKPTTNNNPLDALFGTTSPPPPSTLDDLFKD